MDSQDFVAWVETVAGSERKAAAILGIGRNTVARYRENGAPRHIGLACAAVAEGLAPWRSEIAYTSD